MSAARHKWIKIMIHKYICRVCGCGKVNEELGREGSGAWQARYHTPDGRTQVLRLTPPCETGPRTADYLKKYEAAIVLAMGDAEERRADRRRARDTAVETHV